MTEDRAANLESQLAAIHSRVTQLALKVQEVVGEVHNSSEVSAVKLEALADRVTEVAKDVGSVKERLESRYVTQEQFRPVRAVVWGLGAIVLTAVGKAVVGSVVVG